ncbi:MAG: hypothetical protein Q9186_007570 [Xanthomendoza sp. 1 TL-2023]
MSAEYWTVTEYVIPACHIRGFTRGVKDERTARLRLAVKQYVPKSPREVRPNAMTIIMAHGVGSSKESYEPFFDELLHYDLDIRAVWAMDVAHHGASYILNEQVIGDEPHWYDSSRDMFQMINHFQEHMPPPIVGIGQSWGAVTISTLAVWHPRLFSAIISMEPMFGIAYQPNVKDEDNVNMQIKRKTALFVNRKDTWPSREAARKHLLANPYYRSFDPRVFNLVLKHDLRDVIPSSSHHPDKQPPAAAAAAAVTLTTPKTMELYTILRPDPPLTGFPKAPDHSTKTSNDIIVPGFYRGERTLALRNLNYLLPPVLYLWGTLSGYANTAYSHDILQQTGIALGGMAKVAERFVEGAHHPIPLEKPAAAAQVIAPWLRTQMEMWEEEAERRKGEAPFAVKGFAKEWIERVGKL